MRVLLVKMSSMGDVVHNLPLVADIRRAYPEAQIDWVVEEAYADLVRLHSEVHRVIPIALRRWRRQWFKLATWREGHSCWRALRATHYDLIIDTQNLLKSAVVAYCAQGVRVGFIATSCKEPLAALFYQRRMPYPPVKSVHAVKRYRALAAWALHYKADTPAQYGVRASITSIAGARLTWPPPNAPYAVLVHATARASKLWPESHWVALAQALNARGVTVVVAWGNPKERERAERIAEQTAHAQVVPQVLDLFNWARVFAYAQVVVGLDTGLTYWAAAVGAPVVAVYCDTAPEQAGVEVETAYLNVGGIGTPPSAHEVTEAALTLMRNV